MILFLPTIIPPDWPLDERRVLWTWRRLMAMTIPISERWWLWGLWSRMN